jgi:polyisoprenoid-binding protein YceI
MPKLATRPLQSDVLPAPGAFTLNRNRCLAEFSVKHMVVSTARGRLEPLGGQLIVEEDPLASWVRVDLDAGSFSTGSRERDETVKGPEFLDVQDFPAIRFESVFMTETGPGRFDVAGDLYVKDLVGEVILATRLVTVSPDRIVVAASTQLSRERYGLTWMPAVEKVGIVMADTVKITLGAEFVR